MPAKILYLFLSRPASQDINYCSVLAGLFWEWLWVGGERSGSSGSAPVWFPHHLAPSWWLSLSHPWLLGVSPPESAAGTQPSYAPLSRLSLHRYDRPSGSAGTGGRTSTRSGPGWHAPCPSPRRPPGSAFTASSSPQPCKRRPLTPPPPH